jgi:dTDP-4-amino-4,6-dideoxygalactose transaminase
VTSRAAGGKQKPSAENSTPIPWIDLERQYVAIKPEVDAAIRRVLDSIRYVSGPEAEAFEREWAAYCGADHAVAVGSGTAALNLTLKALGVRQGDEVITVGFTVSASLDAIEDLGARPVLVDVDPDTYTLDPGQIASSVTSRTKAVLPVHVHGHPADIDAIVAVAAQHGLAVVLDACEAHGALYKGAQAASLATASCFSFYPTKNLGAYGDAGAVVTHDADLAARVRLLRQHGWDRRYHSVVTSLNSRMDEIHAAVLRAKLPHLDNWNERRRAIAKRFDAALDGASVRAAPFAAWAAPSYYFYVVASPERAALQEALGAAGIGTDISWPEPPYLQPAYAHLGYRRGDLPVTERLCNEVLTIPMFPHLTDAEVERVCGALRSFSKRHRTATR